MIRKWLLAAAVLSVAVVAKADELFVTGIATAQKVTFTDFRDDKLIYRTSNGEQNDRELSRVSRIAVDGETAFNEAEVISAKESKTDADVEKAIDGYMKTVRATTKSWLRTFAARRLLTTIGDKDRFDARLVAYLALLQSHPETAVQYRPNLPKQGSKLLDGAVTDVENTLKQPNLPAQQQLALYGFLIELHRQRGDENAVTNVLERLDRLSGTLGDNPEVRQQLAVARVSQARNALEQKKYPEAVKLIEDNRAYISDPRQQSDALFILAEAKRANLNKSDKNAVKDTALAYLRVVAHFGDLEGKPNVLPSLLAVAELLEQADDKAGAVAIYEQIIRDFPKDPAAQKAEKERARLAPAK